MNLLKSYRENEIKWYILAYLLLSVSINTPELVTSADIDLITKVEKLFVSALLSGVICSLAFVFDSLYSRNIKDVLLYLGFTKAPGSTVFTRIQNKKLKDTHFEISTGVTYYNRIISSLPAQKKQRRQFENAKWYEIYSRHKKDDSINSVHRDFLLCRDLYIATISMTILTSIAMVTKLIIFNWIQIGYLLILLLITNIAAHNKAHRYVNTVIAVDIALKDSWYS